MHGHEDIQVQTMREELTSLDVEEMRTVEEVDTILGKKEGTVLVVINSVCGCAAGNARPAVKLALQHNKVPEKLTTVFAGQDTAATARAREYFAEYPPSSPCMVLLKDGKVVHMIPRSQIEGRSAEDIAKDLEQAFDTHC